ncbi:MAG: Cna B-type domain-containing protein [Lachnospiraceae bacterium]|nr:Cna B-type domain-containing protein [Lachnospiraceae bacterium]
MRRCRKMISVIMLMVMLVSLLPTGAMAAEAPTGATNEVAAVEEPQGNTDEAKNEDITNGETDKTEDSSTDTSDFGAKENDGTNDVVPTDGTAVETTDEDPAEGTNTEDAGLGNTSTEDAGLGNTSTEIAAEVEPTDQTVKKDEKAAGETNLKAYLDNQTDPETGDKVGGLDIEVWDVLDNKKLTKPYICEWSRPYRIHLTAHGKQLEENTYTYELPSAFKYKLMEKNSEGEDVQVPSKKIEVEGTEYGYYTVTERGHAEFAINSAMNFAQDFALGFDFYFEMDETIITTVKIEDEEITIIDPLQRADCQKINIKHASIEKEGHFHWETTVAFDAWSTPGGAELYDYRATNKNHYFGEGDLNGQYFTNAGKTDKGFKVTATKKGRDTVVWYIPQDDPANFTYDTENGAWWKYKFPEKIGNTTFDEGWTFVFDYTTTIRVYPTETDSRSYRNESQVTVEAGKMIVHDTRVLSKTGTGSVGKTGRFVLDEETNRTKGVDYTISYTNSSVHANTQYGLEDCVYFYPDGGTNTNIPDSYITPWENINVSLTVDEKTYDLPVYDWDDVITEEPADGYYAVYLDTVSLPNSDPRKNLFGDYYGARNRGVLVLNTNSTEINPITQKGDSHFPEGSSVKIVVKYYQAHDEKLQTYLLNRKMKTFVNRVSAWVDKHTNTSETHTIAYVGNKKEQIDAPTNENNYIATYKVTFPVDLDRKVEHIYFIDEIGSTANYVLDSFYITKYKVAMGRLGTDPKFEVIDEHPLEVTADDIELTKEGKKRVTIELDKDSASYTITYKVKVSNHISDRDGNGYVPYDNTFWIRYEDVDTVRIKDEQFGEHFDFVAHRYGVNINKVDENMQPLEGAEFDLFNEKGESVTLKGAEFKSDANGLVDFTTNTKKGVVYYLNTPYFIKESKAPAGYEENKTQYWFVIVNTESNEGRPQEDWSTYFANKGITTYEIIKVDDPDSPGIGNFTVANKPVVNVKVEKIWDDGNNVNGRPDSITVQLKANNENKGAAVTLTKDKNYSYTWEKLDKFDAKGKEINYSVVETKLEGYEDPKYSEIAKSTDEDGNTVYTISITNKKPSKTEVPVEKVWNDKKTQHASVTVKLYADDKDTGKTLELKEANGFKGKFTDLSKYDTNNKEIVYTVKEETVKGYNSAITGSAAEGFKITNTPITNIAVEKIWDDANDQDRKRPTSITVKLKKNGTVLYSATLTAASNWKGHTWSNLPVYDEDGSEITYSVEEDSITGYAAGQPVKSETTDKDGVTTVTYTITNTYSPDTVNAKVIKIWDDDDNADGLRTSIDVQLTRNGTGMGEAYKQTLNKANNWTYEWTGLPANDAGVPITYSVMEITQVNGYTTSKPVAVYDEATKTWNISVTNTHDRIPIKIPVEKVWRDDKTQHDSITVKLLKGGEDTGKTLELNEANGFKGEFTGLPKFENEGKEIEYTIEEVEVDGYQSKVTGTAEGYTITNTILTNIAVEKVWDDANDQDRKRPTSITVHLTKNNTPMEGEAYTATLKAEENWKGYTWSDLPAYDEDGKKITYSVKEDPVAEYTAGDPVKKSEATDEETGVKTVTYSIKNSYSPDTVHAKVVKKWEDNNDQDGLRTSIEVELTKNGTGMGDAYKQTLNEANNWTYQWDGLPANDAGVPITYSIAEITVIKGYNDNKKPEIKTSYDEASKTWNISVTNTHTPIKTEASVTKVWDDENDIEGLQPKEIKVQLLDATGDKEIPVRDEVTLNAENEWTYTWTELDKFKEKGTEIKYTVREVSVPEGYTDEVKVAKDLEGKFKITVTNRHGGRPVSISKTDITNSKEVEGATLQILLNNEVVTAKDAEGKDARAEWTSTKEPHKVYGLTPGVTYTLRETIQPEGFTIIEADTTFSVDENGKVTATGSKVKDNIILVEDAPTFVKVKKVDATSQEEVEGAHIQILDGDKVFDQWDSKKGVVHEVKYLVADRKYTLRETVAPLGYTVISDTEFTVNNKNEVTYKGETVSETIDGVPVILVEDTMTIVKISKTDITGDKELKGATLQILDETGKVVTVKDRKGKDVKCEWVSTDEPHVVEGLEINKTYTLRETISPDGYTIATDATFSIDEKNRVTYSGKKNASGVLLVQDEPTKLYVSKQAVTGDEELPGATLQILDEKENVVVLKDNDGNPVETLEWKSGEEPKYIEGLPTGVNYILHETISPDGYTIASDTKFTIDENGVVTSDGTTSTAEDGTTVLVVKDDFTTVQISKVDTESGAELEGAKLQIIDEDNNIVEEWTSTKEVHVVRGLVANKKYILREQVAPLGYTLTTDTTFSIDMNNVVTSTGPVNKDGVILVNDTMTEVEILKVDSKTGKGLAGAKLQVLDDNGAVCDEWKSTKDAHKIRGLYTGVKYTLHEVEAPKGYDKAKDITFTIDTAGKVSSDALDNGKIVMKDTPTPKKNKTGDEANGSLWALLLMMASGALGGTVWFKRRRRA